MSRHSLLKSVLISRCAEFIEQQIAHVQAAIDSANQSAKNESKSSAGDKHETGKSLMQLEQENHSKQLSRSLEMRRIIPLLTNYTPSEKAVAGSLVETSQGVYYLALGIGRIEVSGTEVFVVSPGSPIGKRLMCKRAGDEVEFNGKRFRIQSVE